MVLKQIFRTFIEEERRVIEERTKAQFEAGAISEAEYKTLMSANA